MPFKKGQSGNPGGRPGGVAEWRRGPTAERLRTLAYAVLEDAANGWLAYRDPANPAASELTYERVDPRDRILAARELVDRVDGKAPQAITGEDGGAVRVDTSAGLLETLKRLAGEK